MDETGFMIGHAASSKVITPAGRQTKFVTHDGNRETITVIECISATGVILPPKIIFKGKYHQVGWTAARTTPLPSDWSISVSHNGWTNEELGYEWLMDVFIPKTACDRIRLLLLDGHSSHISPDFIRACIHNNIIALCLPPHTTHLVQPLDVGVFSPYAGAYKREVDEAN